MFAEINKPFGECVGLDKQNIYDILKTLPLEAVPFIGRRTQAKLASHCQTAYDFACLPYTFVRSLLGKS
ncbi:hypothetical protein GW750_09195 [bacterium]|nr:hypothetical protein [bacterium]